jgi:hypothetical protein
MLVVRCSIFVVRNPDSENRTTNIKNRITSIENQESNNEHRTTSIENQESNNEKP